MGLNNFKNNSDKSFREWSKILDDEIILKQTSDDDHKTDAYSGDVG